MTSQTPQEKKCKCCLACENCAPQDRHDTFCPLYTPPAQEGKIDQCLNNPLIGYMPKIFIKQKEKTNHYVCPEKRDNAGCCVCIKHPCILREYIPAPDCLWNKPVTTATKQNCYCHCHSSTHKFECAGRICPTEDVCAHCDEPPQPKEPETNKIKEYSKFIKCKDCTITTMNDDDNVCLKCGSKNTKRLFMDNNNFKKFL